MVTVWARGRMVFVALALAGTALSALPGAASAQDEDARLRKIEMELGALQREVFPGGDGRFFTLEQSSGQQPVQGTPSTSAVTDILGRLDSIEAQLARLTAQAEVNGNEVSLLAERIAALEAARIVAAPAVAAVPAPVAMVSVTPAPVPVTVAVPAKPSVAIGTPAVVAKPAAAPTVVVKPATAPAVAANPAVAPTVVAKPATAPALAPAVAAKPPAPAPQPVGPSAERIAAVRAIAKPQTTDAGDDEYSYGFRLWQAGLFPEAQQQLKLFVDKYPNHPRISFGRNLLGRAYLDEGKPREAAPFFLQNYQSNKQGDRAADSLLYLAETMIAMGDTSRACIALAEFGDTYPALATGRLSAPYEADRAKVKCN